MGLFGRKKAQPDVSARSRPTEAFPEGYFVEGWLVEPEWDEKRQEFPEWPRAPLPRGVTGIRASVVDLLIEAARSSHPREFGGQLRVVKGVVEEVILMPGTISGEEHAILPFHNMPHDPTIKGTVHSHPSPVPYPSEADRHLFERQGSIHVIVAQPYRRNTWRAFNGRSELVDLPVVE